MSQLKKFRGDSSKANVDFFADNFCMLLINPDTDLRTLSVLITDGQTAVTKRIANNIDADADMDGVLADWLKRTTIDGSENIGAALKGRVFASHNVFGLGRPILLDNGRSGVQLQKDANGKPKLVYRYSDFFLDGVKDEITEDLEKANAMITRNIAVLASDLRLFKELGEDSTVKDLTEEFKTQSAQRSLNNLKISALLTPHVAGMSTAYISKDEEEVKEACINSGVKFETLFPDGLEFGADEDALPNEDDKNVKNVEKIDPKKGLADENKVLEEETK